MTIDPATQPTKVSVESTTIYLPVWKDRDGAVIMTTADTLPIKPVYKPVAIMAYIGERIVGEIDDAEMRNLIDAVNSDEWRTWLPGEAWIEYVGVEDSDTAAGDRFRVDIIVKCLRGGWKTQFPNVGYVYKDGANLKTFKASDDGRYIGKLDGSGGKLADDGEMIILDFECKREISFEDSLSF